MLTLQPSELIKHQKCQNKLDNHQNNNDVIVDNMHGPEVMHDLQNDIDKSFNNNTKLPSYHASSLSHSSLGESSTLSGGISQKRVTDSEFIQIEDAEDDEKHQVGYHQNNGEKEEEKEEENENDEDFHHDDFDEDDEDDDDEDEDDEEEERMDNEDIEQEENVITQMAGWTNGMPINKIIHETVLGHVIPSIDTTTFGEISIEKSSNIRVGNTTLYKGPVTIKQFVYTNSNHTHENNYTHENNHTHENSDNTVNEPISDVNSNNTPIIKDDNSTPMFPIHREYNKVREWLWTWRCAAILCVTALVLVSTVVVISMTFSQHSQFPPLPPAIDPDDILHDGVRFIQRTEWGAQPPEDDLDKLSTVPTPYVIISHTASEACNTQSECVQRVRIAQMMHIEINKWSDIAYNFLIGGDGQVYIGRGWDLAGAHSFGFNYKSIGISFIGTFNKIVPPQRQIHALEKLIEIGVKNGKIAENYKLLGHRQVSETLSPGDVLYSIIRTWDHWSEKP